MGEERLPHLHSQVVRRVDEDIKIISNEKVQQNKQIFPLSYPRFLFLCDCERPCRSASRVSKGLGSFLIAGLMTLIIVCRY